MIPQGEHKLINLYYKGCLPPKINEEDQYFDDQLNKVEYNMTKLVYIFFGYQKMACAFTKIVAKHAFCYIFK